MLFRNRSRNKNKGGLDYWILLPVLGLLVFGVFMVYDASVVYASKTFSGDKYHFLYFQAIWAVLGIIVCFISYKIDYRFWIIVSSKLMWVSILLLFLLVWPNIPVIGTVAPKFIYDFFITETQGAYRWFVLNPNPLPSLPFIGRLSFQPTDLAKISVILYLASWFSTTKDLSVRRSGRNWHSRDIFLKFSAMFLLFLILVVLEPDLGTASVLFAIMIGIYFFAGAPLFYLFILLGLCAIGGLLISIISPYHRTRIEVYLGLITDQISSSYHLKQALIALGSGGFFGLGIGQSRQKYEYLPEVSGDSIFAVIGEEFGFVGVTILMLVFLWLTQRIFTIARYSLDEFGKLTASGIAFWIGSQAFINMAAITGLLPLTGVTLPFLSYGGTSLVLCMFAVGIVLNIGKASQREK